MTAAQIKGYLRMNAEEREAVYGPCRTLAQWSAFYADRPIESEPPKLLAYPCCGWTFSHADDCKERK